MQRRELCFAVILCCFLCAGLAGAQNPVLEGYVVNSVTGQPVPEARVKVARADTEPLYTKTDAQGRFQLAIPEGRGYSAAAEKPGFFARPTSVGFVFSYRAPRPIRIELAPVGVIAGKITDPNGIPVEGCAIEILQKRATSAGRPGPMGQPLPGGEYEIVRLNGARTNDLGEFRASRLDPGTYYVVANKTSSATPWPDGYRITYFPRALDLASAKPIELAAGQEARADIQVVSQEGVRVRGRLVEPAADGSAPARMRYTNLTLIPQQNYLLNANGPFTTALADEFEFSDVLPGKYTLVALTREQPQGDFWGSNEKPTSGIARPIEIKDRDIDGLSVTLQPLRDLPGVITFTERCAPVPVRIGAVGENQLSPRSDEAVSSADGKFVLRGLAPGTLKLTFTNASSPGIPVMPLSVRLGEREVLKDGFDYPFQGDDTLKVVLGCSLNRRPQ